MFAKHTGSPLLFKHLDQRLARLINSNQQNLLKGGKIGLEKETLRVGPDGMIARTRHPKAFGSSLTHPWITTDFAEALLELITPPFSDSSESLQFLRDTQTFVCSQLQDERLWATSMPCMLAGDESIRIAEYGTSNTGSGWVTDMVFPCKSSQESTSTIHSARNSGHISRTKKRIPGFYRISSPNPTSP
jgi:gamma-glutamylcysteine synthetase